MVKYTNITLGTSDPIDLCKGMDILGSSFSGRVGIVSTQNSHQIFDVSFTVLFSRLKLSAYYDYNMGICGPSAAFLFKDDNATENLTTSNQGGLGQAVITLPDATMQAGMFMGFGFGGGVHVVEQNYLPKKWSSPWKDTWKKAFDKKVGFEIDLLLLLESFIEVMFGSSSGSQAFKSDLNKTIKNTSSSWQFIGESTTLSSKSSGAEIQATPSYPIPVDLVEYCPDLQAFNKVLHKIKGKMQFGPQFTLAIPVTLSIDELSFHEPTNTVNLDQVSYDSSVKALTATGTDTFDETTAPTSITTHVSYTAGFTLELNAFFKISACKLFSLNSTSPSLDLLSLMGLPQPSTAPVKNQTGSQLADGCILAPAMTFNSDSPTTVEAGKPWLTDLIFNMPGGEGFPGTIQTTTVALSYDPQPPGMVSGPGVFSVGVSNGAFASGQIQPVFPKTLIPNGDGMGGTASASPTAGGYTVNVTATVPSNTVPGCYAPLIVTRAVIVTTPVIRADARPNSTTFAPAPGPVWNPDTGGAALNPQPGLPKPSDQNLWPPGNAGFAVPINVTLPVAIPPDTPGTITFTLLDANRNLFAAPGISLSYQGLANGSASLSTGKAVYNLPAIPTDGVMWWEFFWELTGDQLNYSVRFILVIDAGPVYGQTEFWLDVWNGAPPT